MIRGTLIGDGLRTGAELRPEGWSVRRIYRLDMSADPSGELDAWTVIDFEADDDSQADRLSQALASVLAAEGGWYADFRAGGDHVIVFAGKVFRYRRGDSEGRARVVAYGQSVGVPGHQLDWPD